ncbi:MAG TPA: multidrug efflux RND transporter permease subunit [Terriglobales bacterium]|nr:multidrug efflux RND transporter permease subunit [Terriglobales bacterium]
MFVDFFIKRPIFSTVCALLIILAGAIAIPTLPIAQFPTLAPPQVTVSSFYNGASAEVVESAVTQPLEQQINGVEGMSYITSSSSSNGSSSITAVFDIGRNVDLAAVDVQNRVTNVQGRLPAEVNQTGISITKSGNSFVFAAGFYSPDNKYDTLFISNYLDVYLKDALKRVKGVGDVFIFGERRYSMRLWLDPAKMASRRLTASDVTTALREQNVQVAAGQLGQPPAPAGQSYQISVRAVGRLINVDDFSNLVVKTGDDGSIIQLKDVGRVQLGAESYGTNLTFNGHEAIGIGVTQLTSANSLEVYAAATAELERLAKSFPPGLEYRVAFDTTEAVSESIRDVLMTLLEAIILVILVIFIFLQDWRTTLIPAVTIPVSLIGTFIFVKLLGFSINTLTLFGITLATGLVVDDAIVVIENVQRHIHEGIRDAHKAASVAMSEVASAVIATSLVLVAVFVPVAFFPGTTGILFKQFALTIAFSVSISAFNALTLSPALAALLLGHSEPKHGFFFTAFNRGVESGTAKYKSALHYIANKRVVVVALFLALLGLAYFIYQRVPRGFVPGEDQGYLIVIVQAPQGASLEYTSGVCAQVSSILQKDADVRGVFAVAGFSFVGNAPNRGIVFASFKPFKERGGRGHSSQDILARVRGPLFGVQGGMAIPFAPPTVQGLGTFGGFQFVLQDQGGHSFEELSHVLNQMVAEGNKNPAMAGLFTSFTSNDPQYVVTIDREKAKSLRVSLKQITDTMQIYLGSQYVNDFDFNNRSYRVYVQADQAYRSQPKDIKQYYVRSDNGDMIALDNLVQVKESTTPPVISHYNLFRSAEIDGSAALGRSTGDAIAAMDAQAQRQLPRGFSYEWTGISREEIQSGGQAALLFALGFLVVYLTLAAQYESFSLPFIVLLAVPTAILGAMGLQYLRGLQNDVYCQIGLVMLIALSSKNSILIVEFAEQLREKGMSVTEAAIEAARIRLRPILMTSFAFILGVLPLVLASGAGSAGRQSVGTTVFGGMLFSTIVNIFFIPILYIVFKGRKERKTA